MSKKQLNVGAIANELEGASLFFPSKVASPTPPPNAPKQNPPPAPPAVKSSAKPRLTHPSFPPANPTSERNNERSNERTEKRTNVPSFETKNTRMDERTNIQNSRRVQIRKKIRHSFDIFADQLISIRELALDQEKMFGERVLISDLVQQAIDMLITKERNK